jgi:hypothetical protein
MDPCVLSRYPSDGFVPEAGRAAARPVVSPACGNLGHGRPTSKPKPSSCRRVAAAPAPLSGGAAKRQQLGAPHRCPASTRAVVPATHPAVGNPFGDSGLRRHRAASWPPWPAGCLSKAGGRRLTLRASTRLHAKCRPGDRSLGRFRDPPAGAEALVWPARHKRRLSGGRIASRLPAGHTCCGVRVVGLHVAARAGTGRKPRAGQARPADGRLGAVCRRRGHRLATDRRRLGAPVLMGAKRTHRTPGPSSGHPGRLLGAGEPAGPDRLPGRQETPNPSPSLVIRPCQGSAEGRPQIPPFRGLAAIHPGHLDVALHPGRPERRFSPNHSATPPDRVLTA